MIVTITLIALCVVIFVMQIIGVIPTAQFAMLPFSSGEYYRLITGAFLHGSIQHLFVNMLSLYNLGGYCERFTPKKPYYLALLTSLFSSSITVGLLSTGYTVGFSGVLFGILGYYIMHLYKNDGGFDDNEKAYIFRVLGPNILVSLMPGVSWQGHLGGFLGGLLAGWLFQ